MGIELDQLDHAYLVMKDNSSVTRYTSGSLPKHHLVAINKSMTSYMILMHEVHTLWTSSLGYGTEDLIS